MGTLMGTGDTHIAGTVGTAGNDEEHCSAWLFREDMGRNPGVKVRVRVGTSRIAGQGPFAARDIRQGTSIIQYIGEKISKAESHTRLAQGNAYIFELNEGFDHRIGHCILFGLTHYPSRRTERSRGYVN